MMWVVIMLLPSLAFTTVKAQDTLVLDIKKALEIAERKSHCKSG